MGGVKKKKKTCCCFQNIKLELPWQSSNGKYKQENKVLHVEGDSQHTATWYVRI